MSDPRTTLVDADRVCGASFMLMVDITVMQVALPTIQPGLRASFTDLQRMIDAYARSSSAPGSGWPTPRSPRSRSASPRSSAPA